MTGHILTLLGFSLGSYFLLAFVLSFASEGVSFFGVSVHFLVLNYIIVTELISRVEKQQQLPARTILKADEFVTGGAAAPAGLASGERLTKEQKAAVQRENEKRFFAKFKADHDLLKQVAPAAAAAAAGAAGASGASVHDATASPVSMAELTQVDSDEEVPSDGEDERARAEEAGTATLINIGAEKMQAHFSSVLHSLIHEQQAATASHERLHQVKLYLLSLGVLLSYSLMVYFNRSGAVAAADWDRDGDTDADEQDRARYLGFIVSGVLVLWDTLVFVYAAYCGRVIDDRTKILVLGGSRVALVSFGFQGWFLGVCCLYAAGGAYLSYRIVDRRMPFRFGIGGGSRKVQRFSEFCRSLTNPDREDASSAAAGAAAGGGGGASDALLAAVSRRGSSIGVGEFVLLILTVLFFMALCVSYQTGPPAASLGTLTNAPWQQWEIGLVVWYGVLLWLLSVWLIRLLMTEQWRLSWRSTLLGALTQLLFALGGYLLFHRTDSVIILVWMVCGPLFVLSLLATYAHCVDVDWRLLRPSHTRNPPNMPCLPALLSCGLPRDDYRMLINVALTLGMMVAIGVWITVGLAGSAIGWSITFVLFILVTSLVPLVKYLKTLALDRVDATMLALWLVAHIAFFALQHSVHGGGDMSGRAAFALWGSCVGYPTLLANILAYHLFQENGQQLTKGTAQVFGFSFVLLVMVVIISFFTLGSAAGGMILGAVVAAVAVTALAVRWVSGSYTLPRTLRWVSGLAFTAVLVAGVLLGVLLPDDDDGFWAYTGSWALLMLYIGALAYGDRARLAGRSGAGAGACFRYSSYLFPVYYFDRRNESNPVQGANLHMALSCAVFALGFCWCAACMVTTRVDLGLGMSALLLLSFYTFARQRTISANKQLMQLLPYLSEDVVRRSKEAARDVQLSGVGMLFDDPQPPVFGLARWGLILSEMLLLNLDPQPVLKRKQNALKRKLGLGRSCFCTVLPTSAQQLDDHMLLLERLNDWSAACAKLAFKIEAHFYFLLLANARAAVAAEESTMSAFCAWLRREKRSPPPALQPVELDPAISNHDIYDAPTHFSQRRILRMQAWKAEYIESLAAAARDNEANRVKEAQAEVVRAKRMEEREKLQAARIKAREAEEKAAEEAALAAGTPLLPAVVAGPPGADPAAAAAQSPEEKQFWRIVAEHARTGVQWEDPDFPATDDSLYLSGERDPSKPAMNQQPIDCWMRPGELLAALAAENPDKRIDTTPRLFIDGFDLTDIEQGNIGTCYFLSAIGCLGVREQATPRYPLLTNLFTMQSPTAEYNACGAWLVRFYRSGVVVHVLIDDRLPTAQNNYAFSHSKLPNEMWVALLEKAYAKLFTCLAFGTMVRVAGAKAPVAVERLAVGTQLVGEDGAPVTVTKFATGVSPTMVRVAYPGGSHLVTPDHLVTLRCGADPSLCRHTDARGVTLTLRWHDSTLDAAGLPQRLSRVWMIAGPEHPHARAAPASSMPTLPAELEPHAEQFALWWLSGAAARSNGALCPMRLGDLFEVRAASLLRAPPAFFDDYGIPQVPEDAAWDHDEAPAAAVAVPVGTVAPGVDARLSSIDDAGHAQLRSTAATVFPSPSSSSGNAPSVAAPSSASEASPQWLVEMRCLREFMATKGLDPAFADAANCMAAAVLPVLPASRAQAVRASSEVQTHIPPAAAELQTEVGDVQSVVDTACKARKADVVYLLPSPPRTQSMANEHAPTPAPRDAIARNIAIRHIERAWSLLDIDSSAVGEQVAIIETAMPIVGAAGTGTGALDSRSPFCPTGEWRASMESALQCGSGAIVVFGTAGHDLWLQNADSCKCVVSTALVVDGRTGRERMAVTLADRSVVAVHFAAHPVAAHTFAHVLDVIADAHGRTVSDTLRAELGEWTAVKRISSVGVEAGATQFVRLEVSGSGRFVLGDGCISHNCYEAIEAGMISQALCDLSNGASEQVALKAPDGQVCVNPEQLWVQMEDSFRSGYLLGAGSNTGMDSDWVNGIAQGHAYIVVRIFTDAKQTEKLVQLQNPHGKGEWCEGTHERRDSAATACVLGAC